MSIPAGTYEIRLRGKNRIVTLVPDQKERLCFKAGNGQKVAVTEKQIVRQVERCAECWLVEVKRPGTYCSQCVPVRARKALVFGDAQGQGLYSVAMTNTRGEWIVRPYEAEGPDEACWLAEQDYPLFRDFVAAI